MDRLQSMRVFRRVIDEGGFASAARSLDLSPSVVTRMVADLEKSLGTRLINRTTRRFILTEAGIEYAERILAILESIEDAESAASAHSAQLRGTLRILTTPSLASNYLSARLAAWYALHPKLILDVALDAQPIHRIEAFDVTLLTAHENFNSNIIARLLGSYDSILCASPKLTHELGTPQVPQDLCGKPYLRLEQFEERSNAAHKVTLENNRLTGDDGQAIHIELYLNPVLRTQSFNMLLQASIYGIGFCALPSLIAQPYVASGQLVQWLPDWHREKITAWAAIPSRQYIPAKTRAMLDFLTETPAKVLPENTQTLLVK